MGEEPRKIVRSIRMVLEVEVVDSSLESFNAALGVINDRDVPSDAEIKIAPADDSRSYMANGDHPLIVRARWYA